MSALTLYYLYRCACSGDYGSLKIKNVQLLGYQFDVSFVVEEKIFRFQVSVNNSFSVQILQRFRYTRYTKTRRYIVETSPTNTGHNTVLACVGAPCENCKSQYGKE